MNDEVRIWRQFSTSTISDALDRLNIAGQCSGIRPLNSAFSLIGRAFTVRMAPAGDAKGTVGDYIDDVPKGYAVVIDNGGRLDATVWGDILTAFAHVRGIAGTAIDGVCRDTVKGLRLCYPIFSRGTFMRTGKGRVQAEEFRGPVSLGGVRVEPEDWVVGDADGIVVVPHAREAEVLKEAALIEAAEESIRRGIEEGVRLDELRKKFGYFSLQRRTSEPDSNES